MIPGEEIFEGDFLISLKKIEGGLTKTLEVLRGSTLIDKTISANEIKRIFQSIPKEYENIFVFLIEHIHVKKKR